MTRKDCDWRALNGINWKLIEADGRYLSSLKRLAYTIQEVLHNLLAARQVFTRSRVAGALHECLAVSRAGPSAAGRPSATPASARPPAVAIQPLDRVDVPTGDAHLNPMLRQPSWELRIGPIVSISPTKTVDSLVG